MTIATSDDTHTELSPNNGALDRLAGAKILFALPSLGAGGAERVACAISNHWIGQGRQVAFATFEEVGAPAYFSLSPEVERFQLALPAIPSPKWKALKQTWSRISALRKLIKGKKPDVVISFLTKMNVMTLIAARGTGVPVIISERNNPKKQKFDPLWENGRAFTFPRASCFVTMTMGAAEFYPEAQRPNLHIIPNPVRLPKDFSPQRGGNTLTAVGRLDPQKRFDLLLEAFAIIAERNPDWRLVIWGEGDERKKLEQHRASLGLDGRVDFPGVTSKHGQWAETADIFVLSSDFEGWPNVMAEALAAELPVVSFDCEFGPKEIIDHEQNGLLVPSGNVEELAHAMERAIQDKALRERLAANASTFKDQYSVEAIAARWDAAIIDAQAYEANKRAR